MREMKDSGIEWIGEIPRDWDITRFKYIKDNNHPYAIGDGDHGTISPSMYQDEGIPYIRVQNLGWGTKLLLDDIVYISEEANKNNSKSILHPGDLVVAKTGATIGKTAIIPNDMKQANTTSSVGKVTVSPDNSNKYYFYVLGSDVCFKQMWDKASQKSAQPGFNIIDLENFLIPYPIFQEQSRIASFLDSKCSEIDSIIESKQQQLATLEQYKKSLIYEYVTGKKEVPYNV